jgi:hypothetical protein
MDKGKQEMAYFASKTGSITAIPFFNIARSLLLVFMRKSW